MRYGEIIVSLDEKVKTLADRWSHASPNCMSIRSNFECCPVAEGDIIGTGGWTVPGLNAKGNPYKGVKFLEEITARTEQPIF